MSRLDLTGDLVDLTAALVDIPSVSGAETALCDELEAALRTLGHLQVDRDGNALVARTSLGRAERVVLAGHIDTVPIADNVPHRRDGDWMHGCGTTDMKGGVAVILGLAATVPEPTRDVTFVLYDCEEIESERNGLGRLVREHSDWLATDLAILLEPTNGIVEAGCQGTLRAVVRTSGHRAHSARSWLGDNAIHRATGILERLSAYEARTVDIDGCTYREGLSAVGISGGVAGNVIPDECEVVVNFRFAPDRTESQAIEHVQEVLSGFSLKVTDSAPGALPGLGAPATKAFLAAVGSPPQAKFGWTDVARFSSLGVPALNFGPGDPNVAHMREEKVEVSQIPAAAQVLREFLTAQPPPG